MKNPGRDSGKSTTFGGTQIMFWNSQEKKQRSARRRQARKATAVLEPPEERSLLSGPGYPTPPTPPPMTPPSITPPVGIPVRPPVTAPPITQPVRPPVTATGSTPISMPTPPPARPPVRIREVNSANQRRPSGIVTKAPHFYEAYTGPKASGVECRASERRVHAKRHLRLHGHESGSDQQRSRRICVGN